MINLQKTVDLVTFTEEISNGKLRFLCNATVRPVFRLYFLCVIKNFYYYVKSVREKIYGGQAWKTLKGEKRILRT